MTLLKHLKPEQQKEVVKLIDTIIELRKRQIEVAKRVIRKCRRRIQFLEDVKKNRRQLKTLKK